MPIRCDQTIHASTTVQVSLTAPLADGRELVQGPLSYNGDGFASAHNLEFLEDPRFIEAQAVGMRQVELHAPETFRTMWDLRYRIYFFCWAADHARRLPGDFVDCGVWLALFSASAAKYVHFERYPEKKWYLIDTYESYPLEQYSPEEWASGIPADAPHFAVDNLAGIVSETFAPYPNAIIVKGAVPDVLPQVPTQQIAYLSVDMNAAKPEVAALEFFWPKMVTGGVVLLDDYGRKKYAHQKKLIDAWAASTDVSIFTTPTGQGFMIKP